MYMTDFFRFLDEIFMLFSYENRKKILIDFSFSHLWRIKVSFIFSSGRVQYRGSRESGDSRPVPISLGKSHKSAPKMAEKRSNSARTFIKVPQNLEIVLESYLKI